MLIRDKVAGFIVVGGQDNVQGVAGSLLAFWSELGFVFPPFPFIGHSRGWDAEDMQNNVRLVRRSPALAGAAHDLAERAVGEAMDRSMNFDWSLISVRRTFGTSRVVRSISPGSRFRR